MVYGPTKYCCQPFPTYIFTLTNITSINKIYVLLITNDLLRRDLRLRKQIVCIVIKTFNSKYVKRKPIYYDKINLMWCVKF